MKSMAMAMLAALLVLASPAIAAAPEQPPAGTVAVLVLQSDGLTWLPVGQAVVPPTACAPGGAP